MLQFEKFILIKMKLFGGEYSLKEFSFLNHLVEAFV